MGRRIAIVGSAPSSVMKAPFSDPLWEIWACSPANHTTIPKVDVWFEMHTWTLEQKKLTHQDGGRSYYGFLKRQKCVIMQDIHPEVPTSRPYPLVDILKRWPWSRYFLTCSPAEMAALALMQDPLPEVIGFWGIDMAAATEYEWQRPALHYWFERMDGLGVKLYTPPEADINQPPPIYGYGESTPQWRKWKARQQELQNRVKTNLLNEEKLRTERLICQGALEGVNYDMRTWVPSGLEEIEAARVAEAEAVAAKLAPQPSVITLPKAVKEGLQARAKAKRAKNGKTGENQAEKVGALAGGKPTPPSPSDISAAGVAEEGLSKEL